MGVRCRSAAATRAIVGISSCPILMVMMMLLLCRCIEGSRPFFGCRTCGTRRTASQFSVRCTGRPVRNLWLRGGHGGELTTSGKQEKSDGWMNEASTHEKPQEMSEQRMTATRLGVSCQAASENTERKTALSISGSTLASKSRGFVGRQCRAGLSIFVQRYSDTMRWVVLDQKLSLSAYEGMAGATDRQSLKK